MDYIADGSLLELDVQFEEGVARLGSYNYSSRQVVLEPQRSPSRLHTTYQILLPQSFNERVVQTTSYDRSLRIGGGFYLKNLFTEEYLSYEDATLRDPLLIRSASPVKMFCFVRPHNLAFQEEGFVGYGVELKLCALNGQTFVRCRRVPGHSSALNLSLSKVDFNPIVLHRSSLESNRIEEGFPFNVYFLEQQCYLTQSNLNGELQLEIDKSLPLISSKFYLERQGSLFYMRSMFFNGYLEFKKGRKPQLSNRRSEAGLLRLHLYSEGNSKEDSNSVIYCLEHVSTGGYFGFGDKGVGLYEGKRLLNAMQLRRCVIDNIGITGFMNTLMEVFNFDPLEQSSDFLRSFLIWTKSKVIKQMQTRHYSGEVSDFELLQREFFEFGLVDKLFRIHVLREEAPVRKEVVMLINFLCKDSPTNSAWLLRAHNFILANFYQEHFDLSEIIGLQELVCLPHNKLRGTLNECNCLLLMLAERGQADDSHPKFLRFFKFTLQLNDASGRSLQSFAGLLRSSRRIQNFKLASRDEEFKLEDQLIFEIYIILAGKSLVGTLPLSSIVAIFKDTSRELKLRKLCVQYLQVEYLQKTYKQPDHVIFESVEEEQGSVIDRQLANYVTSLKEYCMGEVRVVDSTVGDGQIVAVIFLLYMLCLGRLQHYELMEACCNLIAIIEEMEIQQENYEKDYDFLSHSVKLLSRSLHYLNNLRLQTTFREMLKSPVNSERILQEQLKESPELQKLRLQNCLTKVCYFVKLSGSNPRNGMLFLEAQDLLYEYTHHAELYSKELLNSHVVKEFDVEALQAYALVNSVREGVMHHKPMSDFGVLLKKLQQVTSDARHSKVVLMKVQTILRCLRTDELLMGLVRSHILEISLEDLHTTFSVLIVFADDNLVNCQSLLDLLSQVELHFEGEDEMEELYALVRVIVKNPLMRQTEYLPYVERLIFSKQPTASGGVEFMHLMVEVTNSTRPVSAERVVRHLVHDPQTLRVMLSIQHKQRPVFPANTPIDYLIPMFQLINNLKECAQLNRDFRENLLAALPAESYELFRSSEKFFVAPCMDHYQQTYLEVLLIEMLCGFGLFELLPLAVAFNCLLSTVQSYTSCFRSLRDTHFEQVEAFFVKYPKLQRLEMDAVVFAAKILTPLLKQAEDFAVLYDKQLDEDRKQALLRSCRILATEVIACYEGFLTNDDYHRHESIFNESLKILHRSFGLEPDLKFYYNYNSRSEGSHRDNEEQLCSSICQYLEQNETEKEVFLSSVSEELRNIIQSEFEDRRKVVGVMLADMGMGFVIETLLFCLQEATTSYNTTAIPMVMAVEPKPSTMIRAALAIDKLLMIDTSQTIDILLNSNFAELLVDCLGSNYQDIELLLVITLKMMKGNKGELNLEAQRAFQQAFLGKRRPMAMKFIRRVLTDELNNMIGSQGAKTSLEREVDMRLNNKREETNVYLKTVNTVECLCQSLNFDIKEVFGESENRQKSILALLIELLERSLGVSLNNQSASKPFTISLERCSFVEATSKCVISLLHGPHRSNIRRALLLGYQSMCVKVMRINDSLQTLQPSHRMSSLSLRVFEKGDLQHIKRIEPRFYNNYLKAEVAKRENDFNYEFIARLKKLSILTLDLMFEQSVRYQNPAETDEQGKLIESNIVSLYEKLRAVHNVTDEDLIRLLYNKEVEMNFLEKLIALRVFDQHEGEEKEPQLEDLKPSLSLQYGIYMYNYLYWYYEWKGSNEITNAVYKHANEKRLRKRYNRNIGVFYQLYSLVRDLFSIIATLLRFLCKSNTLAQKFARLSQTQQMTATIDFFARNFQTIEIRMEDGATENVCFPLVPEARCFNKSIQRDLFRNIDYNSNHTRLSSFVRCAPFIMMRLELEYSLSRITSRNRGLGVIVKYRELWKSLSFMFGFCQNMVLLLEFSIPANAFIYLTYAFRSWQYAMATLLFIVFLFQSVRLRLIMANEYCSAASLKNSVAKAAVRTAYLVSDKTFFYAFFYTTMTVIGTYYPLLLCLMLLDFFYRFRSTRFLLELFNKPKWSLLNNLVLFIILLYIYSFIFFKNHDVSQACNTILQCVQIELWLSMGLLGSNFLSGKTYNLSPLANLTNTLYIIFVIIYRALFLGIIINQKRKYRREQQLRKSRVDDQCFICGRTKEAINKLYRSEKGFKKHVELQHNLWNYISYLVYVEKLKPEAMSAQEQYVMALWKVRSLDWLPSTSVGRGHD